MEIATSPILQVSEGMDFTNVAVDSIPGAVKFCLFAKAGDQYDPGKYAEGYVLYVNGPMDPMYVLTEQDFDRLSARYPEEAVRGLRNSRIITQGGAKP